ncbi:MAG: hypothetical protein AAB426_09600 [Myxococcota bacterium]
MVGALAPEGSLSAPQSLWPVRAGPAATGAAPGFAAFQSGLSTEVWIGGPERAADASSHVLDPACARAGVAIAAPKLSTRRMAQVLAKRTTVGAVATVLRAPPGEAVEINRLALGALAVARPSADVRVTVGKQVLRCTYSVDASWDLQFTIVPEGAPAYARSFSAKQLAAGARLELSSGALMLQETDGVITFRRVAGTQVGKDVARVTSDEVFDALYDRSQQLTFDGTVTYAVIRNTDPKDGALGIMLVRRDCEGQYFYSLGRDEALRDPIKWIVGINGVLYGMKVVGPDLVFFAKRIVEP